MSMDDNLLMKKALTLAARARGKTSPNPMVGSVIVKNGRVVAEAYHKMAGTPHAEALALEQAGERARGATLYVTLEPCSHTDKRTPPCADAIIRAGVKRVVAAMEDPNAKVAGKGFQRLRDAGIEVVSGILEAQATDLNSAYIKYISTKVPYVILKTAMTLDGKIATPTGQSKWITGEKARAVVHKTRASVDAIITAIGTVEADDPQMTARIRGAKSPLRVVIDPGLKIRPEANILQGPPRTIIVTKKVGKKADALVQKGIELLHYEGELRLAWLLRELGKQEITSVLIEGGSSLNGRAFTEGVVDRAMFFVAPKVIGGAKSFPAVGGADFRPLEHACRLADMKVRRLGDDLLIEGRVECPKKA